MSSHTLADPKIELIHHVDAIRDYGRRMVLEGETLSSVETADQLTSLPTGVGRLVTLVDPDIVSTKRLGLTSGALL